MKTLYEILEVSENASKEVIEKAYKVLAKKYHPDVQTAENKANAEKQMKQINEAYSILSDETKRKEYDDKLESERKQEYSRAIKQEQTYDVQQNNMTQEQYQELLKRQGEEIERQIKQQKMQEQMQNEMQAQYEQKYQQAYENYLRSLGYKIKYKWTWKRFRDLLIAILVIVLICTTLWFFPPTNKMIMDFYNSSNIIKTIIDIIGNTIKGIWNGICSVFS